MEIQNRLKDIRSSIRKQQLAHIMQKTRIDLRREEDVAAVRTFA